MSNKDVELFRRLQVSAAFLLENKKTLSDLRDKWIDRIQPSKTFKLWAIEENPLHWSMDKVAKFVGGIPNCSDWAPAFIDNEIDGWAFLALQQNDLMQNMGISLGAAIKIYNRIIGLREECNAHYIKYE